MNDLYPILDLQDEATTQRRQSALMELVRYLLIPRQYERLNIYMTSSSGAMGFFVSSTGFSFTVPSRHVLIF